MSNNFNIKNFIFLVKKQNKILFESESESEAEDQPTRIQKIKPVINKHPPPSETPRIKLRFV